MLAKWRYRRMRPDDEGKRAVRAEDGTVVIACNSHTPHPPTSIRTLARHTFVRVTELIEANHMSHQQPNQE